MRGGRGLGLWILAAALVLAALPAAALWGVFVHRNHVFPYRFARLAYRALVGERGPARWHLARPGAGSAPISPEAINQLANLPYLQGYRPATNTAGILVHDQTSSQEGLNFFTSGHAPVATLMDMDGRVLKTWKANPQKAFPGLTLSGSLREFAGFFRCARLLPDGGVVALFDRIGLVRLDAASRLLWASRAVMHHDIFVDPSGEIYVLSRESRIVPEVRRDESVWEDFVTELTPDGRVVRKVSILEGFRRSAYAPLLTRIPPGPDLFHTNSLEVFDGSFAARWPLLRKGNILLSVHHLDSLAILDPEQDRIVWALTGQWRAQHCAHLLASGRLLLFDNFGLMREASRVLEVNPFTQELLWQFGGTAGQDLFSETAGFVQRLSNANTLITESNFGRALEVTPDHRVVWEFVNPNRAGKNRELVAALYTVERVPSDLPFLTQASAGVRSEPAAVTSR